MSKRTKIIFIIALILAGIFIKCYYISYTETWERQHDVISFGADEGHAAYIEYLLNNRHLPDFDPREKWAFFQPPLHHIVSAFTIYVSEKFGANEHRAQENTQIATCFYMIMMTLVSTCMFLRAKGLSKLFSKNGVSKLTTEGYVVLLSIVSLHPMYTLLSGSINNDGLALILSVVALVIALRWYDKPGYLETVLLALIIGLAMLAKMTSGLVAIPIGILMFMRVFGFDDRYISASNSKITIGDRVNLFIKKYLAKCVVFAIIVFPLGLGFSIYNKIKWNVPVNFIPPVGENFSDELSLSSRIFDIKPGLSKVYTFLTTRGDAFDEYNIPLAIVKTSLFSEYSFEDVSRWMKPLTFILFVSSIILMIYAFYATIYMVFSKKSKLYTKWKITLFGTYISYFAAYILFTQQYRNFAAQDFRYGAICIFCEGIFAGIYTDTLKNKKVKNVITAIAIVFAMSSFLTYALLGFKSK